MSVDTSTRKSAYPRPIEELLPEIRRTIELTGKIPSRNSLIKGFHMGGPKADEILAVLKREADEHATDTEHPASTDPGESDQAARALLAAEGVSVPDGLDPWAYAGPISGTQARPPATIEREAVPAPVDPITAARSWWKRQRSQDSTRAQARDEAAVGTSPTQDRPRPVVIWPVWLLMLPAFVAVWAGWVELGKLTGFGVVNLLPGIAPDGGFATINSAITLPVGMEVYAAYALYVWLSRRVPDRARKFAMFSALAALTVGGAGQVAYHLLAAPPTGAPWGVTMAVACLPVAVLGMGAALGHLVREGSDR